MKTYRTIITIFLALLFVWFLSEKSINAESVSNIQPIQEAQEILYENKIDNINIVNVTPYYNIPLKKEYQDLIISECKKYSLSETLALAIIKTESNFDHQAISNTEDYGLFQLNKYTFPSIAKELNINNFNPLNPNHNIKAGIFHINQIRNYWQSQGLADEDVFTYTILSYNRGIQGSYNLINRGIVENNRYVKRVIKNKYKLENN